MCVSIDSVCPLTVCVCLKSLLLFLYCTLKCFVSPINVTVDDYNTCDSLKPLLLFLYCTLMCFVSPINVIVDDYNTCDSLSFHFAC